MEFNTTKNEYNKTYPNTPTKAAKITTNLASYSVVSPIKSQKSIKSNLDEPQFDIVEEAIFELSLLNVELTLVEIDSNSFQKYEKVVEKESCKSFN